ncbi:MAG: hypothetical protein AAFW89_12990 [Bacteroidota bacterium]
MAQYPNRIKARINSGIELLVTQYQQFDQSRYLRDQLGLDFDYFIDFLSQEIPFVTLWEQTMQPGFLPDTAVEPYRKQNFSNVNFGSVDFNQNLSFFLFALHKQGVPWVADDPSVYDLSICKGSQFKNVDAVYWYSPAVNFDACLFENSTLDYWYAQQAIITKCTFRNCNLTAGQFNNGDGDPVSWRDNKFSHCHFLGIDFSGINHSDSSADHCIFDRCVFNDSGGSGEIVPINTCHSSYLYCQFKIALPSNAKFHDLDCTGSVFGEGSTISGWCQNNNYFGCRFGEMSLDWYMQGSSFVQANFEGEISFDENAHIDNCDFTGSNLDNWMTRDELKNSVASYNENTLWVDGSPL